MVSIRGDIATLFDLERKVLALYVKRTGLFKQTSRLSKLIKKLESKVDRCIRDFIVVYDDDEIMVIVDTNQRKDEKAFYKLVALVRETLEEEGAAYGRVEYPTGELYDPRKIYDSSNYNGFKVAKGRRIFR